MKLLPYQEDLIKITKCKPEDVCLIEAIMRDQSPILGDLGGPQYVRLAIKSKMILNEVRESSDPEFKQYLVNITEKSKLIMM